MISARTSGRSASKSPPPTPSSTWTARSQDGKPYAKPAAQRKRSEGEQQKRLATEHIRSGYEQRHQDCGELGDDNRGGGETGFPARIGQSELLDDERQHRRVGEMEQRRGGREHEKRRVPDQDAPAARNPGMVGPLHFETSGLIVIDGARGDREHCDRRQHRK